MRVNLHLPYPVPHIIEALLASAVIDDYDALYISEVRLRDGPVAFLAGSVPNREFHGLAVNLHSLHLAVDTYRGYVGGVETLIVELEEETCLANPRVPDHDQAELVVRRRRPWLLLRCCVH